MRLDILFILIRRFEGCKLTAYLCPAGVWTIGWGATGPGIVRGVVWTQEQADARLTADAQAYAMSTLKASPVLALYPEVGQAISDFVYNLGLTRYKASTLKKRVDAQDWDGACEQLQRWVFGGGRRLPGLVLRRQAEAAVIGGASER